MNVRKLMARLNTPSAKLGGGGRGGPPELTPQDIAGALGFIRDPLAREVFCRAWWPDGAKLSAQQLQLAFGERLRAEVHRRERAHTDAKLELCRLDTLRSIAREVTAEAAAAYRSAQGRVAVTKAQAWPMSGALHQRILEAALHELCHPNTCKVCAGVGHVKIEAKVHTCELCEGRGTVRVSNRQRARWLGKDEKRYRSGPLPAMYEFAFGLVLAAEGDGAAAMKAALSDKAPRKAA